jgi:nucleoside-diphosphate-sugar epimerase
MKEAHPYPAGVKPPGHYVEKVSLLSGEVLPDEILPKHLLVHHHRDFHVMDVYARFLISRGVEKTGDVEGVKERWRGIRKMGKRTVDAMSSLLGKRWGTALGKKLLGLKTKEYYFRYRQPHLSQEETEARVAALRISAATRLGEVMKGPGPWLTVLLTGGTGFLGKEIIAQAADDDAIKEMVVVIREREVRDRKTKQVIRVESPEERGAELLRQLWLDEHPGRRKFRFVGGDIEKPGLGLDAAELKGLRTKLTHVIHCAASVSFDDTYENSYRANVLGSLNALELSRGLQHAPGSRFVCHLSIETSYIHGRQSATDTASEDEVVFPRNYYNNFYELTKALGSLETDRFMLERALPVTQLCPAIVVGDSRNGNNRGDTKVVNAPVNVFGRAKEAIESTDGSWVQRSKARMLASLATVFPGNPSAELNLVPVDRVVAGILSALTKPSTVGERIHLATDNRLTSGAITKIAREEIEVDVRLAEPTLHRTVTLPILTKVLSSLDQPRIGDALNRLGRIFGGYSEWGQPVHEVGKDHEVLGLPVPRPVTEYVFRMLCRHNRYVQEFGKVKSDAEISRRERVWRDFIQSLERRTGRHVGAMTAGQFRKVLAAELDLEKFEWKGPQAI